MGIKELQERRLLARFFNYEIPDTEETISKKVQEKKA